MLASLNSSSDAAARVAAARVARLVPKNLVQCELGLTACGAFAVGRFPSPAALTKTESHAADRAADAERVRRVALYGTRPVPSPTFNTIKRELPRNLVACDLALTQSGVFATSLRFCPEKTSSGIAALLEEEVSPEEKDEPVALLKTNFPKAASVGSFDAFCAKTAEASTEPPVAPPDAQLSSSPTSVTASASVGDLRALGGSEMAY